MSFFRSRREFLSSIVAIPFLNSLTDLAPMGATASRHGDQIQRPPEALGIGLRSFDKVTEGLVPGQLMVVAGRPSMGKSVLSNHIARHFSLYLGKKVLYVSPELTSISILNRMATADSRQSYEEVTSGKMSVETGIKFSRSWVRLSESKLVFLEKPGVGLGDIFSELEANRSDPYDLVIVDSLGILKTQDEPAKTRAEIFEDKLNGLKSMADGFCVPIVANYNLCRLPEGRAPSWPGLGQDSFGKQVRANADQIVLIHCPSYYDTHPGAEVVVPIEMPVISRINGYEGCATVGFNRASFELTDLG